MNLFPDIEKAYTRDRLTAREAQRLAQYIAFGPIVFQASRLMLKFGILARLRDQDMTLPEIAEAAGLSGMPPRSWWRLRSPSVRS